MKLQSINPSDYSVLGEVNISTPAEIANTAAAARAAQQLWNEIGLEQRIAMLRAAIAEIVANKSELALLQSKEMGMAINESLGSIDGDIEYCNWYFDNAVKYLSPETTFETDTEIHQVYYEPVGVCAVILPWNFPFANVVWGTLQSLIAGNTIIMKHSEECPLSTQFIENIFNKHLPSGVFSVIYGDGSVGQELLNTDINMVAFTGSSKTGKLIYETASKKFIKASLELGGSAPGIIFPDVADLDQVVATVASNRLYNQGQCCDGLKRLFVHESIFDLVVTKMTKAFENIKVGPAEDTTTNIGPLVSKRQLDLLISQVDDSVAKGAHIVTGKGSLESELGGAFFSPTVLTNITTDMRVMTEEVFGPVLPIVPFSDESQATMFANQTPYGLGAYIFTGDIECADRLAKNIQTGMVSINSLNYVIPCNPFGGYKLSGIGREHGKYGFHEVTQIKVIAKPKL